jgi:SAM-dependent methyltransferase
MSPTGANTKSSAKPDRQPSRPARGRTRRQRGRLGALNSAAVVALAAREPKLAVGTWRLQRLAQQSFNGWATRQRTRWWEYPWVLEQVRRRLDDRTRTAADFGAGRSPVPIELARLGLTTTVVDPDSEKQMNKRVGGEWAWTDYDRWGVATRRAGVEDASAFSPGSLGFAISVSVIEHLPAEVRRQGLRNMANFLEPGGVCVLTVDLVRGSSRLWNRILGAEVEAVDSHGDLAGLVEECREVGLRLEESVRCPVSDRRVDVQGLVLRLGAGKSA